MTMTSKPMLAFVLLVATTWSVCKSQDCLYGFSAVRNTSLFQPESVLPFTHTLLNDGEVFEPEFNMFTAPLSGLYWINWSGGMQKGTNLNIGLRGGARQPSIAISRGIMDSGGPSTTSRDEIVHLEPGIRLYLTSTVLYSDEGLQTSFSGFPLQCVSDREVVAFMVGRSTSMLDVTFYPEVLFDMVHLDTHQGWDTFSDKEYRVPVTGTWVITALAAAYPYANFHLNVHVNGFQLIGLGYVDGYSNDNDVDTASKTTVIHLNNGDMLTMTVSAYGSYVYSSSGYEIALMGFLYNPTAHTPVAWGLEVEYSVTFTGPVDPVFFNRIELNQGDAYDNNTGLVTVPQSGVYYIHINSQMAGIQLRGKTELMINGSPVVNVYHESNADFNTFNQLTIGRSIMLKLNAGDVANIRVPEGWTTSASHAMELIFAGFLVYTV